MRSRELLVFSGFNPFTALVEVTGDALVDEALGLGS